MVNKPTSPNVTINLTNNNVYPSIPLLGVSYMVAVTEKGDVNSPSDMIYNVGQFRAKYGMEIVPDGTVSNIEMALRMGSILRISRVESTPGGSGAAPTTTADKWIAALSAFRDYSEGYQMACSCVHQYLTTAAELDKVHIAGAELASKVKDYVYYIEVPKYKAGTTPNDSVTMIAWVTAMIAKVKNSPYVAYFAGGWKYYDADGVLQNCDTIGTVIGLGDKSSSNYGPWYSFAGQSRGMVTDARGIVTENYGAPSNYEKLDSLAKGYINTSVIKDTKNYGKQPMQWHNFTSTLTDNSEKFLGVVRLILYLKKTLRPILESYLEEPNTFSTWSNLYYEVKPILDGLVDKNAMTEYIWDGDQFATNYNDMSVNTEADVRAGKYKAQLIFKDIIALQDITLNLVIDTTSGSVSAGGGGSTGGVVDDGDDPTV